MRGSYSAVAAHLTGLYGRQVTRQQVYTWYVRETRNRAGEPFPEAVEELLAKPTQPRLFFDLAAVAAWYERGVPVDGGRKRFRVPGNNQAA